MSKLRRKLQSVLAEKQGLIIGYIGTLGKLDGTVAVPDNPNHSYVRMEDQPISEVYNTRVPYIPELRVIVGFDPLQPNLWQVLTEAPNYAYGVTGSEVPVISPHGETHQFMGSGPRGGTDVVWTELRQFMPFRVSPGGGLTVFVHRGIAWDGTQYRLIAPSAVIDLESDVPATADKGLYVLITIDTSGAIITTVGSEVNAVDLAITDIPAAPVNTVYKIAAIRLYEGQDTIEEGKTYTDIIDLRFPMWHTHVGDEISGIVAAFLDLTDTPSSYSGEGTKVARVNSGETAIEFDAGVNISSDDANIAAVNFLEQGSDPSTPATNHRALYAKSDGIYEKDDAGNVTGPLGSGTGGKYRQFVYYLEGGDFHFLKINTGEPVTVLLDLE